MLKRTAHKNVDTAAKQIWLPSMPSTGIYERTSRKRNYNKQEDAVDSVIGSIRLSDILVVTKAAKANIVYCRKLCVCVCGEHDVQAAVTDLTSRCNVYFCICPNTERPANWINPFPLYTTVCFRNLKSWKMCWCQQIMEKIIEKNDNWRTS